MTATSLHHIALACKDPVETHRFYHDVLGLTLVHTESQTGPKGERAGVEADQAEAERVLFESTRP